MLTYALRIKTFHEKIVFVDIKCIINNELQGRVAMIDYGGQLPWTYNGCQTINSGQVKFYPRDEAITSSNFNLVSGSVNHAIHILNPD